MDDKKRYMVEEVAGQVCVLDTEEGGHIVCLDTKHKKLLESAAYCFNSYGVKDLAYEQERYAELARISELKGKITSAVQFNFWKDLGVRTYAYLAYSTNPAVMETWVDRYDVYPENNPFTLAILEMGIENFNVEDLMSRMVKAAWETRSEFLLREIKKEIADTQAKLSELKEKQAKLEAGL